MIEAYQQLKRREMDVARLAREYVKRPGKSGQLDWDFIDELQKYSDANPLFKRGEQKRPSVRDKYDLE
jgi:hypothetical protein